MIIVFKPSAKENDIAAFKAMLVEQGLGIHESKGVDHSLIGLVGDTSRLNEDSLSAYDIVERVMRVQAPYKMANRAFHPADSVISLTPPGAKPIQLGGENLTVIAGPCSVESEAQIISVAKDVQKSGARLLRGGAFKPRTSPYSFQGLGKEAIDLLLAAKQATGLPIVTELMSINQLPLFEQVDIIQIGARNMQNFDLLRELGGTGKPILLKRGLASTVKELLMSAEYIMAAGNPQVILCERGIRTFDSYTRNTLDISAVPFLKRESHLPVVVDPSHACGMSWMVPTLAKAALAAGADGIMIEVHNKPECALCDGEQSLTPQAFDKLMRVLERYAAAEERSL